MAGHLFKSENESIIVRENFDGNYDRQGIENALVDMQLYTRQTRGNTGIFTVAISPREEDKLTPEQQARAIEIIEERFGLQNQIKVQIDHVKEGRAHSHVLWSVVNQEEGKLIRLNNYKRQLQTCSKKMEQEFNLEPVRRTPNKMTVEVSNADRMREGKHKKCQHRKQEVSAIWNSTESAEEFLQQVRSAGYEVAKGDRSAFVLIDHDGKSYNLARELPKLVKTKDIRMRFGELELSSIEEAKKQREEQFYFDRDKQEREQLQRIEDAAIEQTQKEQEAELKEKNKEQKPTNQKSIKERFEALGKQSGVEKLREKIKEREDDKDPIDIAMAQSKKWFDIIDRDREDGAKISLLENKLRKDHRFEDLEEKIKDLKKDLAKSDTFLGRKTGKHQELLNELEDQEIYFEETKQRIQAQVDKLKRDLIESRPPELRPANDDTEKSEPEKEKSDNVVNFEEAAKKSERQIKEEEFKERMRREQKRKAQERDKDKGMDLDI